jgi:hypothetical protein
MPRMMMKMMLRVLRLYFWWWSCGGGYEMSLLWMFLECFRLFFNFMSVWSFDKMCCIATWFDIVYFNAYSLLWLLVLACAGSALWCNDLCGMCFMLSIAISHVTR